ncbi:MAG: DUF885 domain-containing protein [Gammaproteobacteria bacterium]|nr:DUF885 domain-containing protein [Gammaproteobacteria bacterium]
MRARILGGMVIGLLVGCASTPRNETPAAVAPPPSSTTAPLPGAALDAMLEAYFERALALNPVLATSIGDTRYNHLYTTGFSPSVRAAQAALVREYEPRLIAFDRASLDAEHQLSYDIFLISLRTQREGERYPSHLMPLNQFFNFTASFAQMGAGGGLHPFKTVDDYEDFLGRMGGFEESVDIAIANMREGMASGIVQPRVLMERTLPQLAAHIVTDPAKSMFHGPVATMPANFSAEDKARLTAAYLAAIRERIVPAFQRLHDFVRDEYLPKTRTTVGLSALPDGREWYAYQARTMTTTDLTPEQIHQIGLDEVARIHGEMNAVMRRVGWQGDLASFMRHMATDPAQNYTSREEMLADYRNSQARIDASTDKLFDIKPKANYEIRAIEPFRERSASKGSYTPAALDGSRPGLFYLNTYEPSSRARMDRETLLVHEGSPGHHFQISIARELDHLPRMRRFTGWTAFSEGWGLYAETLGPELGLYTDPYQHYGYLSSELWRSIRLVLDTGIHTKGWTLEQATDYARKNSSLSDDGIRSEVERFSAIPGQALAYKIGELKITELRKRAEARLGPKFDIRAFHRAVLEDGAMPLNVLEGKIDQWISAQER